jgi:chromate reductase
MTSAITLSGSTRKGSWNVVLQKAVGRRLAAKGVDVTELDLGDYPLPIFSEDIEAEGVPEAATRLAELFRSHNIVFIASPEYNGSMTPLIVNTITWLSRQKPSPFRHATFGIGGVSSGKYGTIWALSHMRDSLTKIGTLVVPTLLGIGPAETAFDASGEPTEPAIKRKFDTIVEEMTSFRRG